MALMWNSEQGKAELVMDLLGVVRRWREQGLTIVCASGFFNPVHKGHLSYLQDAKRLGDRLVVIVNNDSQVRLKGSTPFMDQVHRLAIVSHLRVVDLAVLSLDRDSSVSQTLSLLNPHIFANGGDVGDEGQCREAETCRKLGIRMEFGVGGTKKVCSSSELIRAAVPPA